MTKEELCQVLFCLQDYKDRGKESRRYRTEELNDLTEKFESFIESYRGPISVVPVEKLVEAMAVVAKGICDDHRNNSYYAGMSTLNAEKEALKILTSHD